MRSLAQCDCAAPSSKMSVSKICSVFVSVMVLCVTRLAFSGPVKLMPRQTAAEQGGAVLFFAAHQGSLRDIEFNPIIFNQVLVNQGSAYNNNTGVFTAPVAGIYQFVFAAQLCRGDHNNMWNYLVNGEHRMSCHAQVSGPDTTVNTCYLMVELKKDERVGIRQYSGGCVWASTTSKTITFSGVLLAREGTSMLGGKYGSGSSCPLPSLGMNRGLNGDLVSGSVGQSVALSSLAITLLLSCLLLK